MATGNGNGDVRVEAAERLCINCRHCFLAWIYPDKGSQILKCEITKEYLTPRSIACNRYDPRSQSLGTITIEGDHAKRD